MALGSYTVTETAGLPGELPFLVGKELAANIGEPGPGTIMAEGSDGKLLPYEDVAAEQVGSTAGDGTTKTFTGTLTRAPVEPGSVAVTSENGTEILTDDGHGMLKSAGATSTGTINYQTGTISVTFHAAPANTKKVTADYGRKLAGVLHDGAKTTASSGAMALVVTLGHVKRTLLKVGVTSPAAPSVTVVGRLAKRHILAM